VALSVNTRSSRERKQVSGKNPHLSIKKIILFQVRKSKISYHRETRIIIFWVEEVVELVIIILCLTEWDKFRFGLLVAWR
jgi:hypothetical protein